MKVIATLRRSPRGTLALTADWKVEKNDDPLVHAKGMELYRTLCGEGGGDSDFKGDQGRAS